MSTDYYSKENLKHFSKIKNLAPEQLKAMLVFDKAVMKEGALSKKEKEIIALAIAHVTECPYCIDTHTKGAKKAGATLEELAEAVFVTAAVEAGGAITHSTHVINALSEDASDVLYERSNLKNVSQIGKYAEEAFNGYKAFSDTAVKEGKLSAKFKEIIAVAVAHASQCPYCIDVHAKNAKRLGVTNEEMAEAIMVTALLRTGGAYAHLANTIQSYEE